MNVLWITNIPFPATSRLIGMPAETGGGWMHSLAMQLISGKGIKLAVATTYNGNGFKEHTDENLVYYLIPRRKAKTTYDRSLEYYWAKIVGEYKPDVIHIHGTEFAHGLACMNACPNQKYVISIQGLVSVYCEYYYAGIKFTELLKNVTLNDIRRCDTIFHGKRKFKLRGILEHDYLKKTSYVIGRTCWDYAHSKRVNPKGNYYKCNETLRQSFYASEKWQIARKKQYSLFVSQAVYPIKGLHQVVKALSIVRNYYPEVTLRVAGIDIISPKIRNKLWSLGGYGLYLEKLAKELGVRDCITFTGPLSENQMTEEYLNAHVFVCPSSIENSPNSIGEAQIIGTPCVASFVGGIPNMITHEKTGLLYRFEEYSMLANQIMDIFNDDYLAQKLSLAGRIEAENRHNRDEIRIRMMEIYNDIIEH